VQAVHNRSSGGINIEAVVHLINSHDAATQHAPECPPPRAICSTPKCYEFLGHRLLRTTDQAPEYPDYSSAPQ
jgi:hypothetical protein